MKKRLSLLLCVAACLISTSSYAWQPSGFVWMTPPFAWDNSNSKWYYFNEGDSLYSYDLAAGQWNPVTSASGWHFFQWPYSYSYNNGRWNYWSGDSQMHVYNFSSGQWTIFGSAASIAGHWKAATNVSGTPSGTRYFYLDVNIDAAGRMSGIYDRYRFFFASSSWLATWTRSGLTATVSGNLNRATGTGSMTVQSFGWTSLKFEVRSDGALRIEIPQDLHDDGGTISILHRQ